MRSRHTPDDDVAQVTRRRLEAMVAELARARSTEPEPARDPAPAGDPEPGDDRGGGRGQHAQRPLTARRRAVGWLEDRLPPGLTGLSLGGAQAGFVALVLAAGLALAGWFVVRTTGGPGSGVVAPPSAASATGEPFISTASSPTGAGSAAPTPSTAPATQAPATASAGAPATGGAAVVVVDVVGKVRRPGIAVLPSGSRVVDAVKAAGGARQGVNLSSLNMARPLVDGEQLVVGTTPAPGAAAGALAPASPASTGAVAGTEALVNINTADQPALETLPGVGPVTAAAILQWRTENGAFTSVDELLEVSGIGDATLAEIAPHVTL